MSNPTLSWDRVGSRFFRNFEGYNLEWTVSLRESHLRMAPAGGTIAVWDRSDVIRQGAAKKPQISLYTGTGKLLVAIPWDAGQLLDGGWLMSESFVVVSQAGHVRNYYDLAGNFYLTKLSGAALAAEVWSHGAVVELERQFVFLTDFPHPWIRYLDKPDVPFDRWTVLPENRANGQSLSLLLYSASAVYSFDFEQCRKVADFGGSRLVMSPNALQVALIGDSVKIYTSDFMDLQFESPSPTDHLWWVGSEAVALPKFGDDEWELVITDLEQNSFSLFVDPHSYFLSEIDGLHILEAETHNFYSAVPQFVVDIFKLGSTAPSSILLNCIDQLDQNSPRANENLQLIGQANLPAAIHDCCRAATYEFDPRWQKRLLRAANFGKLALDLFDSTEYLKSLDKVRVANTLRRPSIGIFASSEQLDVLGPKNIISRLQLRKEWDTAVGLCELFKIPVEPVCINWACAFIQDSPDKDDSELEQDLDAKLSKFLGMSYVEISQKAFDEGRPRLANRLCEREPSSTKRVALLLEMNEYTSAMEQSLSSGNVPLAYYVLLYIRKKLPLPQFYRVLGDNEMATRLYQQLLTLQAKEGNYSELHDFNYQMDLKLDDFKQNLRELFTKGSDGIKVIKDIQKQCKENKFNYQGKAITELTKLLEIQRQLKAEFGVEVEGKTVIDTMRTLLEFGQVQRAQKLKSIFSVTENQFVWLRIEVLVKRRDWEGLWNYANSGKSPIGYKPFFDACVEAGNKEAAGNFVELCASDLVTRVNLYLDLGLRDQAIDCATRAKDETLAQKIRSGIAQA